ncbi:envelope integrity protein Cei [Saccharothrix longispora]|uniref:envelope integrity protein Cei n=1 Tax=Saccharothrix longispora TaxID=33920 RepID=UPI0028FD9C96|nr:envelope integrity protein Cei [Saccharothrix longispora]MBY8851334.1 envelope integrity protein Cei [Saccharothrix sp. MB29]MDU0290185.1 envelope integrity protein Cei [Saccharothrix longispora]
MGRSADVGPGTGGSGSSRYRKRRPWPALILFTVLAVTAVVVWNRVLTDAGDVDAAIQCNPPGTAPPSIAADPGAAPVAPHAPGTVLGHDALDRTDPVPVAEVRFRVFNASTQRNQARFVATMLTELGMQQAAEPGNDPVYPAQDMTCRGQIRFGAPGAGAARTLSLIEPCLELVRDERQDATVDVAVGKKFSEVKPNSDARKVLDQLAEWAEQQPRQQGGQAAQDSPAPTLNADHLRGARDVHC